MFTRLRAYFHRRTQERIRRLLQPGKTVSRFIAKDVKREVLVVDVEDFDNGYIIARIRTNNVLYRINNLIPEQDFGPPVRVAIAELWHWTGQSWGGLADGTSIVDHIATRNQDNG
ncbi:MAG: hypothetical protein AAF802_32635 [Planctomycetota bacterium]